MARLDRDNPRAGGAYPTTADRCYELCQLLRHADIGDGLTNLKMTTPRRPGPARNRLKSLVQEVVRTPGFRDLVLDSLAKAPEDVVLFIDGHGWHHGQNDLMRRELGPFSVEMDDFLANRGPDPSMPEPVPGPDVVELEDFRREDGKGPRPGRESP